MLYLITSPGCSFSGCVVFWGRSRADRCTRKSRLRAFWIIHHDRSIWFCPIWLFRGGETWCVSGGASSSVDADDCFSDRGGEEGRRGAAGRLVRVVMWTVRSNMARMSLAITYSRLEFSMTGNDAEHPQLAVLLRPLKAQRLGCAPFFMSPSKNNVPKCINSTQCLISAGKTAAKQSLFFVWFYVYCFPPVFLSLYVKNSL